MSLYPFWELYIARTPKTFLGHPNICFSYLVPSPNLLTFDKGGIKTKRTSF